MSFESRDKWRDEDGIPPEHLWGADAAADTRTVTVEYLQELYAKAKRLGIFEAYVAALNDDSEFRCSVGSIEEWVAAGGMPDDVRAWIERL